jgi:hypothetical protein
MNLKDDSDATRGIIVNSALNLTDAQAREFNRKIAAVMKTYNDIADENDTTNPDAPIYGLTYAFFPVYRPEEK